MKKKGLISIVIIYVIVTILSVFLILGECKETSRIDTVEMNEAIHLAVENWDKLTTDKTVESPFKFEYAVIDRDENLLMTTDTAIPTTVVKASEERCTIRAIEKDKEIIGWLIIPNNMRIILSDKQKSVVIVLVATNLIVIGLIAVYYFYLEYRIVKPFNKLKRFAANVARGELDIPLDIEKNNIFGDFTESFDMMRTELAASKERERLANISKQELTAQLSHDIKTPVASITAISEVMQVTVKDENHREKLSRIIEKANQIDKLVNDIFNSTMDELNQLHVEISEIGSNEIAELLKASDFKNQITKNNIPDCIVSADKLRLGQVFDNIIFNSYKYADTEIEVSAEIEENHLVIRIADFGGGVPKDELPLIMQKFKRGGNSTGKSGSGLGLYISAQLIEKMGGNLACYNTEKGFCTELRILLS
ncbi:MAG: HAMP domain-containing histidine kinase [Ruminococcus sp.]|nr:HAMP domain-containing histidine kinase [Ruminococcus sp.]